MKIHPESREIDLVVEPTNLTAKEMKEIADFIKQVKRKEKLKKKYPRHKKAA
jgi:hypothetical protein